MSLRTEDRELYESVIICHQIALTKLEMTIDLLPCPDCKRELGHAGPHNTFTKGA